MSRHSNFFELISIIVPGEGKVHPRKQAIKAQRGVEVLPYSFFNLNAGWGG
jgi:hypothetical protein